MRRNGKYGVLKTNGKIVLPIIYDRILGISENTISVKLNGHEGIVYPYNYMI